MTMTNDDDLLLTLVDDTGRYTWVLSRMLANALRYAAISSELLGGAIRRERSGLIDESLEAERRIEALHARQERVRVVVKELSLLLAEES